MPSEVSLELKKVHEIAFYRRRANELRVSARNALDAHYWPTLWALAEGHDDWAEFLEKRPEERRILRVVPEVLR
jgi:hypothetical protein